MEDLSMEYVYQLVIENDMFYDTKEFDSYIFPTEEDAIEYMNMLIETYKEDWMTNFDCESEEQLMSEYVEETSHMITDTYKNFYIEDYCNTEFYIQKKPLLKFV